MEFLSDYDCEIDNIKRKENKVVVVLSCSLKHLCVVVVSRSDKYFAKGVKTTTLKDHDYNMICDNLRGKIVKKKVIEVH